jgi:hypothetical protein
VGIAKSSTANRPVVYTLAPGVLGYWSWGRPKNQPVAYTLALGTLPNVCDLLEGHIALELGSIAMPSLLNGEVHLRSIFFV